MRCVDLRQGRFVETVARLESFARAAEVLRVPPDVLDRQVRALERELGLPLLDRSHRAVRLTTHGRRFLDEVLPALDEVEAAGRAGDLRAVVEALVRPLAELCDERDEGRYWIRFLSQAWSNPRSGLGDVVRNDFNTGVVRGGLMAAALMGDLPPEVIRQRLTLLPGQVLHSFVDADRLLQANGKTRRGVSPFFLHGLIDMIVAELGAPVSAETRAALAARPAAATEGGQRRV